MSYKRRRERPLTLPLDEGSEWQIPNDMEPTTRNDYCAKFAEGYKPFKKWTLQKQLVDEMKRLSEGIGICEAVSMFPRRIANSTAQERRQDRKRANSIGHILRQVSGLWTVAYDVTPEVLPVAKYRRRAAQLTWDEFIVNWLDVLEKRRGRITATCLNYDMISIGNKVAHLMTREIGMIEDAALRQEIGV